MSSDLDPRHPYYQAQWQCGFSRSLRKYGPSAASHAQRSVSTWRVMRRRLLAGDELSPDAGSSRTLFRRDFILRRARHRIREAVGRGESPEAIQRRGLVDPLARHRAFRSRAAPTPDKPFSLRAKRGRLPLRYRAPVGGR